MSRGASIAGASIAASGGIAGGVAGFGGAEEHAEIVTIISVRRPTSAFYARGMRWVLVAAVVVALASVARAQPVSPPTTVIYIVDRGMPVEKLEVVTRSLGEAIGQLDAADRVAVIGAGPTATLDLPLQLATPAAKKRGTEAIGRIAWSERADLPAALAKAGTLMKGVRGTRHVVLVSTGESAAKLEKPSRALADRGITMSVVSYQNDRAAGNPGLAGEWVDALKPAELVDAFVAQSGSVTAELPLAVVLVLDRSGSMSGAKLEAAKESARVVTEVLSPSDMIAIVAFDTESMVLVRPQRAANKMRISTEIARLTAGGGTNIYPGLKDAFELLQAIGTSRKMVIVMTDGEAPYDGISELVQDMRAARIEVSAVGLQGADRNLLSMIAEAGGGRLYMVDDIGALPRIFMKETTRPKRR